MPEGDTVAWTAARLHAALAGRRLVRAELRWPSLAAADLVGALTVEVVACGKHLLHRMRLGEESLTLHSHLRMEGTWRVRPAAEAIRPDHRLRALLGTADATALGRSLGMLDLVRTADEHRLVGHLGPDILAADWAAATDVARSPRGPADAPDPSALDPSAPDRSAPDPSTLDRSAPDPSTLDRSAPDPSTLDRSAPDPSAPDRSAPDPSGPPDPSAAAPGIAGEWGRDVALHRLTSDRRPLAEALLDQRVLAGLGTFWVSEACFARGVSPWVAAGDLAAGETARLLDWTLPRIRRGARTGIQSVTAFDRRHDGGAVHGRSGRPCHRCGGTLRVALVGPATRERTIFYCPRCQGGLAPTDDGRPQAPLGARRRSGGRR